MNPYQGKILSLLDEFMLRLGHLNLLCELRLTNSSSFNKFERIIGKQLTQPVDLKGKNVENIIEYLTEKNLCQRYDKKLEKKKIQTLRYPKLIINKNSEDTKQVLSTVSGKIEDFNIWWQDYCFCDDAIKSRVGTITVKKRTHTGFKHIQDWGYFIGLLNKNGKLTTFGQMLARLRQKFIGNSSENNPYVIGNEKILLAYLIIGEDFDFFARFIKKIIQTFEKKFKKSEIQILFGNVIEDLYHEVKTTTNIKSLYKKNLITIYKELKRAAGKGKELGSSSTAWHRVSSRIETYLELGLLEKDESIRKDKYKYNYQITDIARKISSSLDSSMTSAEWIDFYLADFIYKTDCRKIPVKENEIRNAIKIIHPLMGRTAGSLPIDHLVIGIVWLMFENGNATSLAAVRQGIINTANMYPDFIRLQRGRSAEKKPEFVQILEK